MGSLKKRRKAKINKHKRRKKMRANRHKKRTWQKKRATCLIQLRRRFTPVAFVSVVSIL